MDAPQDDQSPHQRAKRANVHFCFTYEFDGVRWGGEVYASTMEEAEMKIKAMAKGKIDGVVGEIIPAD